MGGEDDLPYYLYINKIWFPMLFSQLQVSSYWGDMLYVVQRLVSESNQDDIEHGEFKAKIF